jgi:DNA-binding PadR family transcriptional regulator
MSMNHVFLGLLSEGARHGYDLKRLHDEQFPGARPLAYGQVYATLQRLVKEGHAAEHETAQDAGPERTSYVITEAGRDELTRWLGAPEPPPPYGGAELVRKTLIAVRLGGDAAGYLAKQRQAHLDRMRELTRATMAVPRTEGINAAALSHDYALAHLDADLKWLEGAAAQLAAQRG